MVDKYSGAMQMELTDSDNHCYRCATFKIKPRLGIFGTEDLEYRLGYCR